MASRLDLNSAAISPEQLLALVRAVVDLPPSWQELDALEWKDRIDLRERPRRAQVAKHLIGFGNRDPKSALRTFEGETYVVLGAAPGKATGMEVNDAAALDDWLRPYTGDELRWRPAYVELDGQAVLVITVEPPRDGDPIYVLERESTDESGRTMRAGTVFVRRAGKTHEATPGEHRRLQARLRRTRADLLIEPWWNAGQSGCWIGVNVTNPAAGIQTTVTEVGFTLAHACELRVAPGQAYVPPGEPEFATARIRFPLPWNPRTTIRPGERKQTRVPAVRIPALVDEDGELTPYAIDVENRQHLGKPHRLFRLLIDSGWREPPDPEVQDPLATMLAIYETPESVRGQTARFDMSQAVAHNP